MAARKVPGSPMHDFWTIALYGAMVLGALVFFHELGHFLVAKWLGVRVLSFSIGMGPRLFGFQKGGTDYRISILPLGGFVRMAGDSPDATDREGKAYEFLGRITCPREQRQVPGSGTGSATVPGSMDC